MIAWREALDLVCRTRGTCLRWYRFTDDGRLFGGTCVRGCGGVECQWLIRPVGRRWARGTSPPEIGAEPPPLPAPPRVTKQS